MKGVKVMFIDRFETSRVLIYQPVYLLKAREDAEVIRIQ